MNTPRTATRKRASENAYAKFIVSSLPASGAFGNVRKYRALLSRILTNALEKTRAPAARQQHSEAIGLEKDVLLVVGADSLDSASGCLNQSILYLPWSN